MSANRVPSAIRRLRQLWFGADRTITHRPSQVPTHHILCAGPYTAPFARLAAEAALASCPDGLRDKLRLFIHVDAIDATRREDVRRWLGEVPGVEVSYGLFGIAPGDRIPGKWHQTMVNDVVRTFRTEKHVAFIDADLFIDGPGWWDCCPALLADDVYALTVGLRDTRRAGGQVAIKTNLFTVNTALHLALNQQRFTKDEKALRHLKRELSGLDIDVGRGLDSMVLGSLRAQSHGKRVIDVEDRVSACHVGGFSHIKASKFSGKGEQATDEVVDTWVRRVRLIARVMSIFRERGWDGFVDPQHAAIVANAGELVRANPDLNRRLAELPPSSHERAFGSVLSKLGY